MENGGQVGDACAGMDPSKIIVTGPNKSACVRENQRVGKQLFNECMGRAGYSPGDWDDFEIDPALSDEYKDALRRSFDVCMEEVFGY